MTFGTDDVDRAVRPDLHGSWCPICYLIRWQRNRRHRNETGDT